MAPWPAISREDYLTQVRGATARMAAVIVDAPLETPVPTCPGWDLRQLAKHTGGVHRWAEAAARTAARPPEHPGTPPPADGAALARWLREGAARLVATLRSLDQAAPTWHTFPVPLVVAVWPRRQAHETLVHAWDAEHAVGQTTTIASMFALDGIAEYFELVLPRLVVRDGVDLPAGTFAVRATDTGNTVAVSAPDGVVSVHRGDLDATPDAALVGSAAGCLGTLWNRPIDDDHVTVEGDAALATAWLALPGM